MSELYRTLVADPGWKFRDKLSETRGAASNYNVMTLDDICKFPLPTLHPIAHLFLWRVASMPNEALTVMKAWGFTPKAELVWLKQTIHGARWFGMGHTVRNEHETCLIGTRGGAWVKHHSQRSTFSAPVGAHSEKPDKFYRIVEELTYGPYAELFARRRRPGWMSLGDELETA